MKRIVTSSKFFPIVIILLSFLPLISIFATTKLYHSHDGFVHVVRIGAYVKALQSGEFPVRWAGDLNFGYGMPLFNFMYQLPYIVASLFVMMGFGLINSFKITIALSYVLSGVFMYLFSNEFLQDRKKAFFVSIFYQFAPFRLVELLIRGSFGEVYTYAFLPLVLFGVAKLFHKPTYNNFLLIAIATALLILSHNALSLVFFGIIFCFVLFFSPNRKILFQSLLGLGCGLALAAFYWIPALLEHKYTYGDLFMKNLYLEHFPPIQNFFIPNFTNAINMQTKGISVQFGLFHVIAIVLSIIVLWKKKVDSKIKKLLIANITLLLLTLFIMQPVSTFVWQHVSLLRQFQFSWRFLGIVAFSTSLLSISFFFFKWFEKKWIYGIIIFLVVVSTILYWKPALGYDTFSEKTYWNYPLTTTYFGETDVIWSEGPAKSYPKQRVEFIGGSGEVINFSRTQTLQSFTVIADKESSLVDHLEYFPGWRVFVNGKSVPLQFQDPNWRGQITFSVPKGNNTINVTFGETPLRFIADIISIVGLVFVIVIGFVRKIFYEA